MTNLIISTESVTGAHIQVRHAKNESSMILDRSGTRTSVVLHKFAMNDPVLDSDLRIAALSTGPVAIEEIDSKGETNTPEEQERNTGKG